MVGRHRGSARLVQMHVPIHRLSDLRVKLVYEPRVILKVKPPCEPGDGGQERAEKLLRAVGLRLAERRFRVAPPRESPERDRVAWKEALDVLESCGAAWAGEGVSGAELLLDHTVTGVVLCESGPDAVGPVAGMAAFHVSGGTCQLLYLGVLRTGAGAGSVLLGEVVRRARSRGCGRVRVAVAGPYDPAASFFARRGFVVSEEPGPGGRVRMDCGLR